MVGAVQGTRERLKRMEQGLDRPRGGLGQVGWVDRGLFWAASQE
jgi:hypothetical protein